MKVTWRTRTLFLLVVAVSSFTTLLMLQDFKEAAERSHMFSSQRTIRVRSMSILGRPPSEDLWSQKSAQNLGLFGLSKDGETESIRNGDTLDNSKSLILTDNGDGHKDKEIRENSNLENISANRATHEGERFARGVLNVPEKQFGSNGVSGLNSLQELDKNKLPSDFKINLAQGAIDKIVPIAVENTGPLIVPNADTPVESKNNSVPQVNPADNAGKNIPVLPNVPVLNPIETKHGSYNDNVPVPALPNHSSHIDNNHVPVLPNSQARVEAVQSGNPPLYQVESEKRNIPVPPKNSQPAKENKDTFVPQNVPMKLPIDNKNIQMPPKVVDIENIPANVPAAIELKPNVPSNVVSKDVPVPQNILTNTGNKNDPVPANIPSAVDSKKTPVLPNVTAVQTGKDMNASSNGSFSAAQNTPSEDVCQLLLDRQSEHLSPLTTINRRIMVAEPPLTRQQISEIYRQGCGLTPALAPDGQPTWREGAMLYIPKNETGEKRFGHVTVYNADFEPHVPYNHTVFFEGREHAPVPETDHKIILTRLAGWDDVTNLQKLRACPDLPCKLTTDWKKYYKTASAVTFNGQLVRGRAPRRAHPDQVFIMYFYEPLTKPWPAYNHIKNPNNGWMPIFNWTMSYHITSDIVATYGMVRKRPQSLAYKNYTEIVSRKSKKVAWFVSHCNTEGKREKYVAELQKYIPVDIYGACGPLKCRKEVDTTCFSQVGRDYKFYFAFENSICEDYTTEKLYRVFKSDAIIVSRGNNYNFRSLPDGTYIDASEFTSPRALAERLLYLDSHDDEYMALLRRKDEFFASYQDYPHYVGKYRQLWVKYTWEYIPLCEVCQRIWNLDRYRNSYPNILDWLNERKCKPPTDL